MANYLACIPFLENVSYSLRQSLPTDRLAKTDNKDYLRKGLYR